MMDVIIEHRPDVDSEATVIEDEHLAKQLAYVVSHDLRSSLNHISTYLTLLEKDIPEGAHTDRVETDLLNMKTCVGRMEALLHHLLLFSRVPAEVSRQPVVMMEAIHEALYYHRHLEKMRDVVLHFDDLPDAQGHSEWIRELYRLLVHNAIVYSDRPKVLLEFTAMVQDGAVVYGVRDQGDGIPEQFLQAIFEPGKRLHSMRQHPGSGMGLAVAQRIVSAHGGRIWAKSSGLKGQGTTIYFTLSGQRQ